MIPTVTVYRERRAQGLCGVCGQVPSKKAACERCAAKIATSQKATYWQRRDRGECTQCGEKSDRAYCPACMTVRVVKGYYLNRA